MKLGIAFIFVLTLISNAYLQEAVVDELEYSLNVLNGDAVLTIDLPKINKAKNDLVPEASLSYSSGASTQNGPVGLGWTINGLSEIKRCVRLPFNPTDHKMCSLADIFKKISYDFSDDFCLDDQKLVLKKGQYGREFSEYATKIDSYRKIVAYGQQGKGPKYFKVYTNQNLILTYGQTFDSTLSSGEQETIGHWHLSKTEDYLGNSIIYTYSKEYNHCYIKTIEYENKRISFAYKLRTDKITTYYDGKVEFQLDKRLDMVTLYVNDVEVSRLNLDYEKYGPVGQSLLKSVKKCFNSDLICTNPLTFAYENENITIEDFNVLNEYIFKCGQSNICESKQMVDMNADGLADLIGFGEDGVYVALNQGSTFGKSTKWTNEFSELIDNWNSKENLRYVADVNSDGLPDIVGFGSLAVYVGLNTGEEIQPTEIWSREFCSDEICNSWRNPRYLIDLNNDGYLDIYANANNGTLVSYNNGSWFKQARRFSTNFGLEDKWVIDYPNFLTDINADGVMDIFGFGPNGTAMYINGKYTETNYVGESFGPSNGWNISTNFRQITDLNMDLLPDLIGVNSNGEVFVGFATIVNGQFEYNNQKIATTELNAFNRIQSVIDLNGDEYPDLVFFDCDGVYVLVNNGNGFNDKKLWNKDIKKCDNRDDDYSKFLMDLNGDGLNDIIEMDGTIIKIGYNQNRKPRIVSLTDSLKNRKYIEYATLPELYFDNGQESKLNENFKRNDLVVSKLKTQGSNPNDENSTSVYFYSSFMCSDVYEKRACTFDAIKYKNEDSSVYLFDEYFINYPLTGRAKAKTTLFKDQVLTKKVFTYNVDITNYDKYKYVDYNIFDVTLTKTYADYYYENGDYAKSETTEMIYDKYGNLISSIKSIKNDDLRLSKVTTFEYDQDQNILNDWYLNKLKSKSEIYDLKTNNTATDSTKIIEESYEFDRKTRLMNRKVKNDLEEIKSYDELGNLIQITMTDLKTQQERVKTYEFDAKSVNMVKETNELGHVSMFKYDQTDNLIELIDPNGISTVYSYGPNRKLISQVSSGFAETKWSFEWDTSMPNAAYRIEKATQGGQKTTVIYDSMNREIRTVLFGYNSSEMYEDSCYSKLGQIKMKTYPYNPETENPSYYVISYDVFMRQIEKKEIFADINESKITKIKYDGSDMIITDDSGFSRLERKNILDQIIMVEDSINANAISSYLYDSMGNLIQIIDPQGIKTEMKYDTNRNLIDVNDPYNGQYKNFYNAFDQLTESKYSSGETIKYVYDNLGRLVQKVEPDFTTEWTFDTAQNGIGLLSTVVTNSVVKQYTYNRFGQEIEVKLEFKDKSVYSVRTKYDQYGRVATVIYPSDVELYKCYNENGFLSAISLTDESCDDDFVWKATSYDGKSNVLSEVRQNGHYIEYEFNDFNQISSIKSKFFDTMIHESRFEYNIRNNLVAKFDVDLERKETIQKYSYDSLDRITNAEVLEKNGEAEWEYDSIGNIQSKKDIESYIYKYNQDKPQQLDRFGNEIIYHDSFGRVFKTYWFEIDWHFFSQPKHITTLTSTISYEYGPDKERIVKRTNNTEIHYIGNEYEKWIINHENNTQEIIDKYNIYANNKLVAQKIVINYENERLFHFREDAFGNIETVSDEDGSLLLSYEYSVFGHRSTTFSNISHSLAMFFNKGFLKNDLIDDRLVVFRGRLYDSIYGRFLSPDPYIQAPYYTQNLNRYSYGLNNPFKYNDENGFNFIKRAIKAFSNPWVIVGIVLVVVTADALAPMVAGLTFLSSMAAGAIQGAANSFVTSLILSGGDFKEAFKGV